MKKNREVFSIIFIAFSFLFISQIEPWGSWLTLFERVLIVFVVLSVFIAFTRFSFMGMTLSIPLILLLGVSLFSIAQFPTALIYKDWLSFALLTVVAFIAAGYFDVSLLGLGIALAGLGLIVYTLVLVWLMPQLAIDPDGLWRGGMTGKNNLALTLIFTLPAIMTAVLRSPQWFIIVAKVVSVGLVGFIIFQTKSASSTIAFVLIIGTFLLMTLLRHNVRAFLIGFAIASFGLVLSVLNQNLILQVFSKGPDFHGRIPLWESSIRALENKWMTGYGWSNLFGYESPAALFVQAELGRFFLHSHNELIYWLVMTGLVGAALLVVAYLSTLITGSIFALFGRRDLTLWIPLGVTGLIYGGITEISSGYIQGWFVLSLLVAGLGGYLANTQKLNGTQRFFYVHVGSQRSNQVVERSPSTTV
jgi:O-antigen ligase